MSAISAPISHHSFCVPSLGEDHGDHARHGGAADQQDAAEQRPGQPIGWGSTAPHLHFEPTRRQNRRSQASDQEEEPREHGERFCRRPAWTRRSPGCGGREYDIRALTNPLATCSGRRQRSHHRPEHRRRIAIAHFALILFAIAGCGGPDQAVVTAVNDAEARFGRGPAAPRPGRRARGRGDLARRCGGARRPQRGHHRWHHAALATRRDRRALSCRHRCARRRLGPALRGGRRRLAGPAGDSAGHRRAGGRRPARCSRSATRRCAHGEGRRSRAPRRTGCARSAAGHGAGAPAPSRGPCPRCWPSDATS